MQSCTSCQPSHCPVMNRRGFLKTAGIASLAVKMGIYDKASEVIASTGSSAGKPKITVAFLRPDKKQFWLGWPGVSYNIQERERHYSDIMNAAAEKLGVELDYVPEPISSPERVAGLLDRLTSSPPDGLMLVVTFLIEVDETDGSYSELSAWRDAQTIGKNRGDIPTIVFSPMGTSFTHQLNMTRNIPGVFTAATQDLNWLGFGVRMFRTIYDMKQSHICIVAGDKMEDRTLDTVGTTLHYVPGERFAQEFEKVDTTDEMRQVAEYYTREAKMIIEPSAQDILTAAKNYVVIKRIMSQEKCGGYSMDCLGPVGMHRMEPPCLTMSRLQDEGIVGACEAAWLSAISQRLTNLLFERPGFIQDPAPNTISNTLIGAHCTSPTKLNGFDKPHEPFILRSHSESAKGVSFQVLWQPGQKVTVMQFTDSKTIIAGTGTVLSNIDTPPAGGCRTSVELVMNNCDDTRDVRGFHQLFIYGDLERSFRVYGELSGVAVKPIVQAS